MALPFEKEQGTLTYADYLTWPEGERWELIEGVAYPKTEGRDFQYDQPLAMSPAPSRRHQQVSRELLTLINVFLKGKSCEIYDAPFEVRLIDHLPDNTEIRSVIQPDLVVICDPAKLDDRGCLGTPDWIIEIISPGTARLDFIKKLALYEKHQVREYWIVHPIDQTMMVFQLNEQGQYGKPAIYSEEDTVSPRLFPDLQLSLKEIFETETLDRPDR